MSNIVKKTVLQNGTKSIIAHYYFESDGVEGELINRVLIDMQNPTDEPRINFDTFPYDPNVRLTLSQAWWSFAWFDGVLGYTDPTMIAAPFWVLPRDSSNYMDFRYFGGIIDRTISGIGQQDQPWSGVSISTNGFAPLGSSGTLVLEFRKNTYSSTPLRNGVAG